MVEASTISFQCPSCSSRITVPGKFAGKSGACSKCGEKVIAPKTQPAGHDSTPGSAIVDEVSGLHGSSADLRTPCRGTFEQSPSPAESIESPTARLVARLWQELQHGGEVELHIAGSSDQFYHNSLSVVVSGDARIVCVKSQTNPLR